MSGEGGLRRAAWVGWIAAAASIFVAAGLGMYAANLRTRLGDVQERLVDAENRLQDSEQRLQAATRETTAVRANLALLTAADVVELRLAGQPPAPAARARAFLSRARGVLFAATSLPAIPNDRTYQLWYLTPGRRSAPACCDPMRRGMPSRPSMRRLFRIRPVLRCRSSPKAACRHRPVRSTSSRSDRCSLQCLDGLGSWSAGNRASLAQDLRRVHRGRRYRLRRPSGRSLRFSRPQRCGQDLDDEDDRVRVAVDRRRLARVRAGSAYRRQRHQGEARRGAAGRQPRRGAHRSREPADVRALLRHPRAGRAPARR